VIQIISIFLAYGQMAEVDGLVTLWLERSPAKHGRLSLILSWVIGSYQIL